MDDLIFTRDNFFYPSDKTRAFRNYLNIVVPEIVNMPNLGFSVQLFNNLGLASSQARRLIENSVLNGAGQYNIVVKSYTSFVSSEGLLNFADLVLG